MPLWEVIGWYLVLGHLLVLANCFWGAIAGKELITWNAVAPEGRWVKAMIIVTAITYWAVVGPVNRTLRLAALIDGWRKKAATTLPDLLV